MLEENNLDLVLENHILKAKIIGDIDHHSAKPVREKIDNFIYTKKPSTVIIDLSMVDFMDSSGLGLILGRYNTAKDIGASFILYKPSVRVKKILELAGLERIMIIKGDDKNEAC